MRGSPLTVVDPGHLRTVLTATLDTTRPLPPVTLQPTSGAWPVGRHTSTLRVSGEGADNT